MSAHASRFGSHLAALNAGALIVVAALAFRPQVTVWITLGLAVAVLCAVLTAFAVRGQGTGARVVEVLLGVGAGWTIVAARVFAAPHTLKWLCLADGVMIWALGGLGLLVHEAMLEARVRRPRTDELHRREMTGRPSRPSGVSGRRGSVG